MVLETDFIEVDAIATIIERCINREVTLILTDIGRGIVSIDKKKDGYEIVAVVYTNNNFLKRQK